jgi:hypothetical protein
LYREEDYWFSIDSHMRAVEHWDQLLIDLLQQCHSAKAIITAYPHDYTLPNQLSAYVVVHTVRDLLCNF